MKSQTPTMKCENGACDNPRAMYRLKCHECDPLKPKLFLFQVISDLDSNLKALVWAECAPEALRIAWESAEGNETFLNASAREVSQPEIQTLLMIIDKV